MHMPLRIFALGVALHCMAFNLPAEDTDDNTDSPETHTVERGPFKVEVTVEGVFEAVETHEVALRPEVWSTLKVEKAVEEGTLVEKGQPILWLDAKQLDEEIRDAKFSRELGYLGIKQAEIALHALEESAPLDLEDARRSRQTSAEDLAYFLEVDEPQQRRTAEETLKSSEYNLEYAQEELDQLEQMYKADDLTEETEEIILKRAQRAVERSAFFLESARLRHVRSMEVLLPREKQQVQESAIRAGLNLAKTEASLPTTLETNRIELEKLLYSHKRLEERLELLEQDLESMVVKAPHAGVVYYGQAERGKWSTASTIRKQLRPGGSLSANTVLMTIVPEGPSFVRVDVPEKEFRYFGPGTPAIVKPVAYPDVEIPGECEAISPVPVKDGTFDGRVSYEHEEDQPQPVVGMTCKVELTPHAVDDAIAVPSSAVFEDEQSEGDSYVYIIEDDEHRQQPVTTGEKSDGKTEILSGLEEGDEILLEKP